MIDLSVLLLVFAFVPAIKATLRLGKLVILVKLLLTD
jgi:hypothetical protein